MWFLRTSRFSFEVNAKTHHPCYRRRGLAEVLTSPQRPYNSGKHRKVDRPHTANPPSCDVQRIQDGAIGHCTRSLREFGSFPLRVRECWEPLRDTIFTAPPAPPVQRDLFRHLTRHKPVLQKAQTHRCNSHAQYCCSRKFRDLANQRRLYMQHRQCRCVLFPFRRHRGDCCSS